MAYCRWSSDNFQSDVYVYEDIDGTWITHVAGSRIVGEVREKITLPHAGETFSDAGPGEAAETLLRLRSLGYYVPVYAIEALRDEAIGER